MSSKIPSQNDFLYFKSFPEFSTISSDIKGKSLSDMQLMMNAVEKLERADL